MLKGRLTLTLVIFATFILIQGPIFAPAAMAQSTDSESSHPTFKVGGFLQQQFIVDQTPDSPVRFSTHRARLGVTGSITDRISINLIGGYTEPPNNSPRLVNAFIDFDVHPLLQVRTGQFLVPFGLEGPQPIPLNPAIERSSAIRQLNTFGMFRDVGVQLSGSQSIFNYAIALVNGTGANQTDQIDPKDVAGRVGVNLTDEVNLGISGHIGQYQTGPSGDNHESRFRAGTDVSYQGTPVFLKGEYILRQDDLPGGGSLKMNGGYLLGGYQFTDELQTIILYEYYEPNTSLDDDHLTTLTIGANYYFVGNTRVSVNYEFRDDRINKDIGNLLTVQMQLTL